MYIKSAPWETERLDWHVKEGKNVLLYLMLLESDRDEQEFLQIYDQYRDKLYYVAVSILKSDALAQESVQNAFLSVALNFKKIMALPCEERSPYIVTIVENDSLNILKRERRISGLEDDWDIADPAAGLEDKSEFQHLVEIINNMPDTYRDVLVMKFVWEWSDQHIAKRLGISETAVSSRVSRGRAKLMKELRQEGYNYDRR